MRKPGPRGALPPNGLRNATRTGLFFNPLSDAIVEQGISRRSEMNC
jgi:hypothetical protein